MTGDAIKLYSYWRSSACYRVRIALNLKQLPYETVPVHLAKGEQHADGFHEVNPQELIPVLMHGGRMLRQSLAIIDYLDENFDANRPLMPNVARERQRVRAIAQMIACDIHPLNNLRVQQYLEKEFKASEKQREAWTRHWIEEGFVALEAVLQDSLATGTYCEGDSPTMADCCLVPQVYNANRVGVKLDRFPNIRRINDECLKLPAFVDAPP
jgi:maleylacetoacetate isomerase